jgi:hypothetical protein
MNRLVEFPLTGGGTVLVQVSDPTSSPPEIGERPLTRGHLGERQEQLPARAAETFDHAVHAVQPAAEALLLALTQISQPPEEVGIEFAIALSADAGAFIATLGASANFKVSLTWRPPHTTDAKAPQDSPDSARDRAST